MSISENIANINYEIQISIILLQERHFTVTFSPGNLMNRLEPHCGQIGQDLTGSINISKRHQI